MSSAGTLRLLQLTSPALPIGAFAYSRGLEFAAETASIRTEDELHDWVIGAMNMALARTDVPALLALHQAFSEGAHPSGPDGDALREAERISELVTATRESRELWLEDRQLALALLRLLASLDVPAADALLRWENPAFVAAFALAASHFAVSPDDTALGYLYMFAENQVIAALRLMPFGQTQGQRVLSRVLAAIPDAIEQARRTPEAKWGSATFGLALGSALHETQYSRMFRS